jgi:hypothetical protein
MVMSLRKKISIWMVSKINSGSFVRFVFSHMHTRHIETEQPLYVSRPTIVEGMWWYQQAPYPADKVMPTREDLLNSGISCCLNGEDVEMEWYH